MLAPIQELQCFRNIEKRFVMKWTNMCFRKLFCGFMQCYINSRLVFLSVVPLVQTYYNNGLDSSKYWYKTARMG